MCLICGYYDILSLFSAINICDNLAVPWCKDIIRHAVYKRLINIFFYEQNHIIVPNASLITESIRQAYEGAQGGGEWFI